MICLLPSDSILSAVPVLQQKHYIFSTLLEQQQLNVQLGQMLLYIIILFQGFTVTSNTLNHVCMQEHTEMHAPKRRTHGLL